MTNVTVSEKDKVSGTPKAGDVLVCETRYKVLVTHYPKEGIEFSAVVLDSTEYRKTGHFSEDWIKASFTPFHGTITIECE